MARIISVSPHLNLLALAAAMPAQVEKTVVLVIDDAPIQDIELYRMADIKPVKKRDWEQRERKRRRKP